jgi:TonB family protein
MVGVVAVALCAAPIGAQEGDEPLELVPSSAWVMDYADDSCALRRAFKAGDLQAILQLRQFGPGNSFEVSIASSTLEARRETPRVRFEPDDEYHEPAGALYIDGKEADVLLYGDSFRANGDGGSEPADIEWPDTERDARERSITALSVREGLDRWIVLKTGAMHQPMNAMRTCIDELLGHWGLDASVQRTLSRRAAPLAQESWAKRIQARYPTDMLRAGRSGLAVIRLIVGADGKPASCIPNKDAPDRAFDEEACKVLRRYARFEPALDAGGQPTASFWTTTIIYTVN